MLHTYIGPELQKVITLDFRICNDSETKTAYVSYGEASSRERMDIALDCLLWILVNRLVN